jgi:hypothetical protein
MKEGNIFSDPLFIDPNNGNYHLQSNSPCIDTGINLSKNSYSLPLMYVSDMYYKDKDGRIRIQDGNNDSIAICDMGAYEFFTETEIDQNQPIQLDQNQPIVIPPIEEDQNQPVVVIHPIEEDQNQPIQLDQNQPIDQDQPTETNQNQPIETDQNQPAQINQDKDKSSSSSGGCFIETIFTIKNSMFIQDKKRGIKLNKEKHA